MTLKVDDLGIQVVCSVSLKLLRTFDLFHNKH